MSYPPISDYAFISDCHSAALLSKAGSVDWCCLQRFDSRPVFSRILDWKRGGFFQISSPDILSVHQSYIKNTNILQNKIETQTGVWVLIDCLTVRPFNNQETSDVKLKHQAPTEFIHSQIAPN